MWYNCSIEMQTSLGARNTQTRSNHRKWRLQMATSNDTIPRCIYRIVNSQTGHVYVGQTYNPKERKRQHFRDLESGIHRNPYLQHAYHKYGKQSFYFEILENGISNNDVDERETYWISYFDSYNNGYNNAPGG